MGLYLLIIAVIYLNKWIAKNDQTLLTEQEYQDILLRSNAGHYAGIYKK